MVTLKEMTVQVDTAVSQAGFTSALCLGRLQVASVKDSQFGAIGRSGGHYCCQFMSDIDNTFGLIVAVMNMLVISCQYMYYELNPRFISI